MSLRAGRCYKVWKMNLFQMKGSIRESVRGVDTETVSMEGCTLSERR